MRIRNQNVDKLADFVKESCQVRLITAVNQSGVTCFSFTPGYRFKMVRIASFCSALVATVSANVLVGGRTAAAVTFTAATESLMTLSTTIANICGSATEAITVQYTTGASGALTDGYIDLEFRPRPLAGEQGPFLT